MAYYLRTADMCSQILTAFGFLTEDIMPYPIIREILIVICTIGGTAIGYLAGRSTGIPTAEMGLAFAGMAVGGAFADLCLRR